MTRKLTFSAAHADWISPLSPAENRVIFGAEASSEPYGHNYALDVSVIGEIDFHTGIVINIKVLDKIVKEHVVEVFDKKFINRSVAEFENHPVTLENLTDFMVEKLRAQLPPEVTLSGLRLEATPTSFVEWHSEDPAMLPGRRRKEVGNVLMTRVYEFAASHRLHSSHLSAKDNRELFGKCNYPNGHGHNYEVEVTVSGPIDARSGRVMAPELLDEIANREVIDRYDHRHFNHDVPEFADLVPSAEIITRVIWERLEAHIPPPTRLYRVLVRETPRNIFEYYGAAPEGDTPRKDNDVL